MARLRRLARALPLAIVLATLAAPPTAALAHAQGSSRRAPARPKARARTVARPTPPPRPTTPRSAEALASDMGAIVGQATRSGRWGVMVVSLTRGDTLYRLNAGEHFMPASTLKLFTGALALERFGPEHRFQTAVLRDGPLRGDGTLDGDIVIRGGGDPALSGRFLRNDPHAAMNLLASLVAGQGVKRVTGDVIGDPTLFEPKGVPDGWQSRYLQSGYAARVSALSLNENLVWIAVSPGAAGGAATVAFEPATSGIRLVNSVQTRKGAGAQVTVRRLPDHGMEVRGWVGTGAGTRRYQMVVEDPPLFATGAFAEALRRRGIAVDGTVRIAPTPDDAEPLTALPSPTMEQLVAVMERESINHYAELLFRNAARDAHPGAPGSAETGNRALGELMTRAGAVPGSVVARDGSGLSVLDQVTPRALVQLLAYGHRASWGSAFHASLPVAGESELLRTRMRGGPAHGNLHAKTGTTNEVISLAGYTTAENGEVLAFAFVYNGTDRWNARVAIDALGETLSGFGRS